MKARALLAALGMVLEVGAGFQLLFLEEDGLTAGTVLRALSFTGVILPCSGQDCNNLHSTG